MIRTRHQVLIPAAVASLFMVFLSGNAETEWTDAFGHSHSDIFAVDPDPIRYREETKQQREAWSHAMRECTPVSPNSSLTTECLSVLDDYFVDQPIWDYSMPLRYYTSYGRVSAGDSINPRFWGLTTPPFGYDDYMMEEIPLWRDVFDGRLRERITTFLETVDDPSCEELTPHYSSGLQPDKFHQCSAREMFKFATFLESCTTASQRLHELDRESIDVMYAGQSNYEMSVQIIAQYIHDAESREIALRRLKKGYLHAFWVVQQCESNDFELVPEDYSDLFSMSGTSLPPTRFMDDHVLDWNPQQPTQADFGNESKSMTYLDLIAHIHDTALDVSAKSGDEWAIRSIHFFLDWGIEFTNDVFDRYPLLKHRHLGFKYFARSLSGSEQKRHQAKAYLLLEKEAGSAIAEREFNVSELKDEIEFVRQGGVLKYPDSMKPNLEEVDRR